MSATKTIGLLSLLAAALASPLATAESASERAAIERGEYLARIGGCNDCHTPGYPEKAGGLPTSDWLTGSAVGFQGPWGTTYPANLRNVVQRMTEDQWVARVRAPMRPPMPWFNLRDMSEPDVRALYRFVKSLGAKGVDAPAYAAPGGRVATPYISFTPVNLPTQHAAR